MQRLAAVLLLSIALGLPSGVGATAAAAGSDPGDGRSATERPPGKTGGEVTKTGWWWAANQPPQEAETGLAAYPQPTPPNVPAGTLPVAAAAGDPEKLAAIELRLDAEPGAQVATAELVLQESTATGATTNAESAKVLACPVTEFWADGTAARWDAKPSYDCDLARAEGERDKDGRWTFDLAPLATLWLGEEPTTPSLVLVESVEAPESFQVAFEGLAAKGIRFAATYVPPSGTSDPGGEQPGGPDGGGATDGSSPGTTPSGGLVPSGSLDSSGQAPVGAGETTTAADGGTVDVTPTSAPTTATAAPVGILPWHAGLPKAAVLLVPFGLGLAYLAMLALGPDAQPTVATSRHGVSRALERLRAAGAAGARAMAGVRR